MKAIAMGMAVLCVLGIASAQADPLPPPSPEALAAAQRLTPTGSPFVERPSLEAFMAAFPSRALQQGVEGTVDLDCLVRDDYRLACVVIEETPRTHEFGDAALELASQLRIAPTLENGQQTRGGKLYYTIEFVTTGRNALTGRIPGTLIRQSAETERRLP